MSWSADIYSAAARLICIKGEIEKWRERDRVGEGQLQLKRTPHEQEPEICIDQTDNLIRATGKRKKISWILPFYASNRLNFTSWPFLTGGIKLLLFVCVAFRGLKAPERPRFYRGKYSKSKQFLVVFFFFFYIICCYNFHFWFGSFKSNKTRDFCVKVHTFVGFNFSLRRI